MFMATLTEVLSIHTHWHRWT